MIFARNMKEIANLANERKRKGLEAALQGIYLDLASEVEEKIKTAAENGLYNASTGDLYNKIKPEVRQRLIKDGYNLDEAVLQLACMIQKRFFECEFDVKTDNPTLNNNCYCVYIAWDKEPQRCAFGRANPT